MTTEKNEKNIAKLIKKITIQYNLYMGALAFVLNYLASEKLDLERLLFIILVLGIVAGNITLGFALSALKKVLDE